MLVENEYRVIGPPGCIAAGAVIEVNRIGIGAAGISRKFPIEQLVERFNSAIPGGYFRGNGYARKTTTLWDSCVRTRVRGMSDDGKIVLLPLVAARESGVKETVALTLGSGHNIVLTGDHEVATPGGMMRAGDLIPGESEVYRDGGVIRSSRAARKVNYLSVEGLRFHPYAGRRQSGRYSVPKHRLIVESRMNGIGIEEFTAALREGFADPSWAYLSPLQIVHHKDRNTKNNDPSNLEVVSSIAAHSRLHCAEGRWRDVVASAVPEAVVGVRPYGFCKTYDLTTYISDGRSGNFLANGIVVSNCGKTTYLGSQVATRVDAYCRRTQNHPGTCTDVLVSSLTKAAASEVRGRDTQLSPDQVGTLHSHAYRALGNPKMCVSPAAIKQWNEDSPNHQWQLSGAASGDDDVFDSTAKCHGDELMSLYGIYRSRMTPRAEWRPDVEEFAREYDHWKFRHSMMDYHDLINECYVSKVRPLGNPSTILVDEVQDHDLQELRLLRQWAKDINKLIIVGDQDQNLYSWRGADPRGFYASQIPDGHTKVLEQSYRVPRAVHATAVSLIEKCRDRVPVVYHPKDAPGEVIRSPMSMTHDCGMVVDEIERILSETNESVMALFSCAFMASPLCEQLRARGIVYWNQYSPGRGRFNPFHPANGRSMLERLRSYLRPSRDVYGDEARMWTYGELQDWVSLCDSGDWLVRGAKVEIESHAKMYPHDQVSLEFLRRQVKDDGQLRAMSSISLAWLGNQISSKNAALFEVLSKASDRASPAAVVQSPPRVTVGTVHSVKGGEADNVFVCPDLSASGWDLMGTDEGYDALLRMFYVAMTRSARSLTLTRPGRRMAFDWSEASA